MSGRPGSSLRIFAFASLLFISRSAISAGEPIKLEVDATEAPRKILHARMHMPAQAGQLTLLYPKWIPGEHGPSGPITDLVGLKITAGGKRIEWRRDDEDMFAFKVNVPDGASALDVAFDFLLPPDTGEFSSGPSATARLVDLSWNQVLLYPQGPKASDIMYAASLRLPQGWKYGTALPLANKSSDRLEFAPVSLETLVDSPVIAGAHFRSLPLSSGGGPGHFLDIVADSDAALEIKAEDKRHFAQLVSEAGSLFGARHYRDYHFLLTLSDHVASFGLEHHESSDDREGERYLIDDDARKLGAFLLPHEMVHSWNGKYRRPRGLATPDFHHPMKGDLLWVYEGLTDYLGIVLAGRSGLWTNDAFNEYLAAEAAALDRDPGRKWRPLADTAVAAQLLYYARPEGAARRRSTDFYQEGDLIWLEVDAIIRRGTKGERSLDDFCKKFHGGKDSAPAVVPYTLEDVISTLNEVYPHDWKGFFHQRIDEPSEHAPLGGVEACGWRMGYTNTVPELLKARESARKSTDVSFSLGFVVKSDGYIIDVVPGSPADKAGVAASMKLLAVNGRRWSPEILRAAIKAAASEKSTETELLLENNEFFRTCKVDYHEGEKYPLLQRIASQPDLLSQILKPRGPGQVAP
jgi:predicted metalloprotease with PDZ domain